MSNIIEGSYATKKMAYASSEVSPRGNARPENLANEVVHLFRPGGRITGEIRHVDGGYNNMG